MKKKKTTCTSKSQDKYDNKWLALSSDEENVIAEGKFFIKTLEKANQTGEKNPVMCKGHPKSACLLL